MSDLSFAEVGEILRLLQHVEGADVTIEWGDLRIHVRRGGAPAPEPAPRVGTPEARQEAKAKAAEPAETAVTTVERAEPAPADDEGHDVPGHWLAVPAPMAGTFYRAAQPGESPFVDVGDQVSPGDVVGLIEVMKLFTDLTADVAGKIARVEAADGVLVEYGAPLLWIEPA